MRAATVVRVVMQRALDCSARSERLGAFVGARW